jgi:hypothetical protein
MAWEDVGNVASFPAGATVTRLRGVKISGADNTVIPVAATTDIPIGVAKEGASTGGAVPVQIDGITRMEAGAAVTRGGQVMCDTVGRVIDATSTNVVIGTSLEAAAAAGVIISVSLNAKTIF